MKKLMIELTTVLIVVRKLPLKYVLNVDNNIVIKNLVSAQIVAQNLYLDIKWQKLENGYEISNLKKNTIIRSK